MSISSRYAGWLGLSLGILMSWHSRNEVELGMSILCVLLLWLWRVEMQETDRRCKHEKEMVDLTHKMSEEIINMRIRIIELEKERGGKTHDRT